MKKMIRAVLMTAILSIGVTCTPVLAAETDEVDNVSSISLIEEQNTSSVSTLEVEENKEDEVIEVVEEVEELQTETVSASGLGELLGTFKLTSYCGCRSCNGKWTGYPTASGTDYEYGRTIAVDSRVVPLGTWVYINIPGEGWQKFRAEDTGSAIKGNKIDVYVGENHANCYQDKYNCKTEVRLALQ